MIRRARPALLALALAGAAPQEAPPPPLRVPPGFSIEKVSPPEVSFPMFACFDDRGRLYVTESSGEDLYRELQELRRRCRIRVLEDRDGDGRFETSRLFAESLSPSMGLAWRDGKLYAADPPDLVALEDADGDGRADRRTVLQTGFGHKDNGSLHGLVFGPDGLLYGTLGTPDGYALRRRDGTTLTGTSGILFRCRPDGSDPEVVARGFVNLIEVAFLPGGDVIGTVNWFQEPAGGVRDALVHIAEGGLYPYAPDTGTPYPVTGEPLPAAALYPAVALSGLTRYAGAAFPEEYRGRLFSAQHNSRKVVSHTLQRHGSTYRSADSDFVTTDDPDFHPSDVLEAPDGSLLVVDTGSWYVHHCPTGKIRGTSARGGLYRVRWTGAPAGGPPAPAATLPVGRSPEDLCRLLPDPAVARALARRGDRGAALRLAAILESTDPAARFAAAEALASCGTPEVLPALWKALEKDPDRFLEHALVHAIHRIAGAPALAEALGRPHPRVRKAALLLLDQPPHAGAPLEALARAAADPDPDLRRAALGRLRGRRDGATAARHILAEGLARPSASGEEGRALRDLIRAFESDPGVREAAARAVRESAPGAPAVLEAIAETALRPPPAEWRDALGRALEGPEGHALAALRAVTALRLRDFDEALARLAAGGPRDRRRAALRARVEGRPRLDEEAFAFLLSELSPDSDPAARLAAGETLARARLSDAQAARALRAVRGDALLSPGLILAGFREATGAEDALLGAVREAVEAGWRPAESELEALLARFPAEARERAGPVRDALRGAREDVRARLARYEALLSGGDPARGREVFFGRRAGCGACHAVGPEGGRVGPDLTRIGAVRAGRDLLESILLPSSTFAQGYEPYVARTEDGEVFSGLLARRTEEAVVLRDAAGAEIALSRRRLRDLRRGSVSVMPEGLERNLSEAEFRDLLAFLRSLR